MLEKEWLNFTLKCFYEDCPVGERVKHLTSLLGENLKEEYEEIIIRKRSSIKKATKKYIDFFNLLLKDGFEITDRYLVKKIEMNIKNNKEDFFFKVDVHAVKQNNFVIYFMLDFPESINGLYGVGNEINNPMKIKDFIGLNKVMNQLIYDTMKLHRKELINSNNEELLSN